MKNIQTFSEKYGPPDKKLNTYKGEVEIIVKDCNGVVISHQVTPNIVKIFAKEMLAHRLAPAKVWDPTANSGSGGWTAHDIDIDEFAARYIVFGASFDSNGNPLSSTDTRYYTLDTVTGSYVPISLDVGADYDGGLINAVPISEPYRPLKRVERIYFESSYQPAGTPLLQEDVRAMNNIVVFETTLLKTEYNGFGLTGSDYFTITEVALVGAEELTTSLGACECDPRDIFLKGATSDNGALIATVSGADTVSLSSSEPDVDLIKEGDQVKVVAANSTAAADDILDQLNPYYLVTSKRLGGRDITLDRTPVTSDGAAITGEIGLLRDGFRIFSARILKAPVMKSSDFEIVVRWRIIMA